MKKSILCLIALFLLPFAACDKGFEDLNTDPSNPTETTVDRLFAGYLSQTFWNYDYWANNAKIGWMNWTQQITSTTNRGLSEYKQSDIGKDNMWIELYTKIFQTYRVMELELSKQAVAVQERSQYRQAAMKVILYFYVSKVSDLYGDIPFSEAALGLADEPILFPKYDTQESIYRSMLEDLEAINTLFENNDPEQLSFANTEDEIDIYFNNDWLKWQKYANSLRLRLAMRVSEVAPDLAQQHVSDILNNGLPIIETPADHAGWNQQMPGYENPGLNDAHIFDQAQGQRSRAAQTMWDKLADSNNDADIFDVRARVFFTRNGFGQWLPIPSSPLAQEQNNIDLDPLFDADIPALYSILTPKFMGGRNTPERHFLSSETAFLKAEAYWRGWAAGDAQAAYEEGIRRSITWYVDAWNSVNISSQQLTMPSEQDFTELFNHPKNAWNTAQGLELIMNQKWIDNMLDPLEAYSDWRRTGFPVLEASFTASGQAIEPPLRFVYPQSESIDNSTNYQAAAGNIGGDTPQTRVWWDVQ